MEKNRIVSLILVLCLGLTLLAGCGSKKTSDGDKATATLILIDQDEKEYTYTMEITDGATLREALFEAGLITEEEFGAFFVQNIDGHIADVENDGCTWLPMDADKNALSGKSSDDITLKNGDTLYLQYYVVPDFD